MIVVCTRAPIVNSGFKVGDMCIYDGLQFVSVGRSFNEETSVSIVTRGFMRPPSISVDYATEFKFQFKPIDNGYGNVRRIWLKKYFAQRNPNWQLFPDDWQIVWRWVWSDKWDLYRVGFKSREEANEGLTKI